MNTKRNRWLLAALGVVVLFFVGDTGYRKFVEEPKQANERLKEQLDKRIKSAKLELAKSKKVTEQLEQLELEVAPLGRRNGSGKIPGLAAAIGQRRQARRNQR